MSASVLFLGLMIALGDAGGSPARRFPVAVARKASAVETLAAREVVRYVYLRTGALLPIVRTNVPPEGEAIVVATKGRALLRRASAPFAFARLAPQEYVLRTLESPRRLLIVGGDETGALYGAYRFA